MCDKSWTVCPEHSNEVTDMSLYNSVYDTESVTTIIHDLNYIHFMQKSIVCMSTHIHALSEYGEGTIFMILVSPLIASYAMISNMLILYS